MSTDRKGQETGARQRLHVLIVDDEEPIAEALVYVVEDMGYTATHATGGRAALELVAAGLRPALIVTDLMMPQMDGASLIGALRAILGPAMPPVILMTAANLHYTAVVEVDATLPKPFNVAEVERLLDRFLAN